MYVNAPSILAGLLSMAQAGFSVMVVVAAARAVRVAVRARTAEERDAAETEQLRPTLPAAGLLIVTLASWPLLIGVLDSYVGEWPSTMCIQGITQIGERSLSAVRHLPMLLDVLFVTKPLVILSAAAWIVAHSVSRRAPGRPGILGPLLLLGLGVLAALDAAVEVTYLAIPKEDDVLSTGCCMTVPVSLRSAGQSWLETLAPELGAGTSIALLAASLVALAGVLLVAARRPADGLPLTRLAWAGVLSAAAAVAFLAQHVAIAVVSPAVHGVASHRCGWCVVERTTWGGLSMGMLALALGSSLMAALAAHLEPLETRGRTRISAQLARLALAGLLFAAILAGCELV